MKKNLLLVIIIFLMGFSALAQDAPKLKQPRIAPQKRQIEKPINKNIDKNVRLDFTIISQNGNTEKFYLITASQVYETELRQQDNNNHYSYLEISGKVRLLVQNRIFVAYEFNYRNQQKNKVGEDITLQSSVILKPGQEIEVANQGNKTLKIKASYLEMMD